MKRRTFIKNSLALSTLSVMPFYSACTPLTTNITHLSALELSMGIKTKQFSCVEVMQAYLSHIQTYNPVYNAIISMADDQKLLDQAKLADDALAKGQYWGWMLLEFRYLGMLRISFNILREIKLILVMLN
mgnify:CR=1 FL=1